MAGGKIVLKCNEVIKLVAKKMIIMGNTCLYGATGGKLFAEGTVGERFAVRNSGCVSVIEGSGDHACEYMTGGAVIVLGDTGVNFGAGMTGGLAFVYDKDRLFKNKINTQSVEIKELNSKNFKEHQVFLLNLIKEHFNETKSLAAESLGVWNADGLNITLTGDSNDYVGKGMAGGKIVLKCNETIKPVAKKMIIMGNTCLYGATGGKLFAEGTLGERFAVRNSGAISVIEGSGDHACEYMTGGAVIVLGDTGVNFGAGMTGGLAFVYDKDRLFKNKINTQSVEIKELNSKNFKEHQVFLLNLIKEHFNETKSLAAESLGVWNADGLNITLTGDSNDYVGKGMAGGQRIVYPPKDVTYKAKESVIIGNTCMYGATGGKLYASGIAGERFAGRNSGATAIVRLQYLMRKVFHQLHHTYTYFQ
jgi:glutamate synthase domain-containing protein 3